MEKPKEQPECTVALDDARPYDVSKKAAERRQRILQEAGTALAEARAALDAIAKRNTEQALIGSRRPLASGSTFSPASLRASSLELRSSVEQWQRELKRHPRPRISVDPLMSAVGMHD